MIITENLVICEYGFWLSSAPSKAQVAKWSNAIIMICSYANN